MIDNMREAFEKAIFSLGYNIDRYSAIYPETVGQYMHMGVQTAYEVYQAALSQPRMTEDEMLKVVSEYVKKEPIAEWVTAFHVRVITTPYSPS